MGEPERGKMGALFGGIFDPSGAAVAPNGLGLFNHGKLAGVVGFEPTVHCTKNSCLTTWLHPNRAAVLTPQYRWDQDP